MSDNFIHLSYDGSKERDSKNEKENAESLKFDQGGRERVSGRVGGREGDKKRGREKEKAIERTAKMQGHWVPEQQE